MAQLKVCTFCGVTGKIGANFVLCLGTVESRVHKYCGERLRSNAPEGATVRLVHFGELAREKREAAARAEQDRISGFWAGKFAEALARSPQRQRAA